MIQHKMISKGTWTYHVDGKVGDGSLGKMLRFVTGRRRRRRSARSYVRYFLIRVVDWLFDYEFVWGKLFHLDEVFARDIALNRCFSSITRSCLWSCFVIRASCICCGSSNMWTWLLFLYDFFVSLKFAMTSNLIAQWWPNLRLNIQRLNKVKKLRV